MTDKNYGCGNPPSSKQTILDPTIKGDIALDASAIASLIEQLCPGLDPCITAVVKKILLDFQGTHVVENLEITGELKLAEDVVASLVRQICAEMEACVLGHLRGAELHGVRLFGATVDLDTLNHLMEMVTAPPYILALVAALAPHLKDTVLGYLDGATFEGVKLYNPAISGGTIKGAEISNSTATNTTLNGNTTFNGDVAFSVAVKESMVQAVLDKLGITKLTDCDGNQLTGEGIVTCCGLTASLAEFKEVIIDLINQSGGSFVGCDGNPITGAVAACTDVADLRTEVMKAISEVGGAAVTLYDKNGVELVTGDKVALATDITGFATTTSVTQLTTRVTKVEGDIAALPTPAYTAKLKSMAGLDVGNGAIVVTPGDLALEILAQLPVDCDNLVLKKGVSCAQHTADLAAVNLRIDSLAPEDLSGFVPKEELRDLVIDIMGSVLKDCDGNSLLVETTP